MDNRPIGVFDSGLGGLTAVKELMNQLPGENIVYFGDTGRVPYGTRSNETVIKYVLQDIRFLLSFDIKLIIIACGTASSIALETVKNKFDVPIVGVVHSTAEQAVKISKNKKIGIIGTQGTINSGAYERKIMELDNQVQIFSKSCPLFVPLVENGYTDNQVARLVAEEYLNSLISEQVDTLILGCTHYPLLKKVIADVMGHHVNLIEPGVEVARHTKALLDKNNMLANPKTESIHRYFVSDNVENFSNLGSLFLQKEISDIIEKIDIEEY
jgi:glutamate racemase